MDIFKEIQLLRNENKEAVLCIITETKGSTPRKTGSKMLVYPDKKISGTIGGGSIEFKVISDALEVLRNGVPQKKTYNLEEDLGMHCGGLVEIYFEPLKSKAVLNIFGAGHIGKAVARYASEFGFNITLIDNRKDVFTEFDTTHFQIICEDYFTAIEKIVFSENTYNVVVTPNHEYDENIVALLAKKPFAYLGMIGSKRKVAETQKKLQEKHGLSLAEIERIDMPIGIPFRAETPEEIAISIVAKLIDVKNSLSK